MRQRYIVTYDICDPKRLRAVFFTMKGYGDHLQYSVFSCDLTLMGLATLKGDLLRVLDARVDQVLFIDLGPTDGRGREAVESLGRGVEQFPDGAVIL